MTITNDEIRSWEKTIDTMTQEEMARLQRFASGGHPVFDSSLPLYDRFQKRFQELGGMTPEISKRIGWKS